MRWVYAHWWMGCNFGDMLTPYLIEKLSGKRAVWAAPRRDIETFAVAGSILTSPAMQHCTVWGCGVIDQETIPPKPRKITAVRGPVTRNRLMDCGIQCPPIYGDPGLLLPRVFNPIIRKRYALGIVPHWKDLARVYADYGNDKNAHILNVTDPVERFLEDLLSCERIASSSLHGLVAADAYGIPSIWVEFSNEVHGRKVKFKDYWEGMGETPVDAVCMREKRNLNDIFVLARRRSIKADLDQLMKVCPFI